MRMQLKTVLKQALSAGGNRNPEGWLKTAVACMSILIFLIQIYLNLLGTLDPFVHGMLFMAVILSLVFVLKSPLSEGTDRFFIIDLCISILLLIFTVYFWIHQERFVTRFPLVDPLSLWDMFFGILIFAAVFEAMRRTLGAGLTVVVSLILIYVFTGHLLDGPFYHRHLDLRTFIDHMIYTINGVGGTPMRVASTYVFVFITLGAFLENSGGGDFFFKLSNSLAGGQVGGAAKVSVVSSAAFGTISGSPTADVATTGSFTIPLMKRLGYNPVFAGAVEATASTGGALLPPIMGTAAFLMVEFTGTPYREIVVAAILPAILYYFGCMVQVHLHSQKQGLTGLPRDQIPGLGDAFRDRGEFLLAFGTLIYLIYVGYTPTRAGIITLAITIPISWIRTDFRLGPKRIAISLIVTTGRLAPLIAACAAAGLVVGGLNVTGLASKFITMITTLAHGYAPLALLISAGVLLLLGMGMPLPVVYILGASLIAPGLMELGIPEFQAHLFIVFFSAMSAITPPVAVAAYTAASIANADPMAIGWQAVKLAVAGFVVPFVFVFQPHILFRGEWYQILQSFLSISLGIFFASVSAEGFFKGNLTPFMRVGILAGSILLLIPGIKTDLSGFVIGLLCLFSRLFYTRKGATPG